MRQVPVLCEKKNPKQLVADALLFRTITVFHSYSTF